METIDFHGWIVEVDRRATAAAYASVHIGGALECGCADCMRFIETRRQLVPDAVNVLFERLAVDPEKEIEVANFGPDDAGQDIWSWWYHLIGRVVATPVAVTDSGQIPLTPVSEDFALGFTERLSLARDSFKDAGNVIQVECFYYKGKAVEASPRPERKGAA